MGQKKPNQRKRKIRSRTPGEPGRPGDKLARKAEQRKVAKPHP